MPKRLRPSRSPAFSRFVLALALLGAMAAAPCRAQSEIDLTGKWSYSLVADDGGGQPLGSIAIRQVGGNVTGDWAELSRSMRDEFGFTVGERVLEASLDGAVLRGRLRLNYAVSNREACPHKWQTWGEIEIALPQSPTKLDGRFRSSAISPADCSIRDEGWLYFALVREAATTSITEAMTKSAAAGVLAESGFDTNASDWLVGATGEPDGRPAPYAATGGNPGGFIETGAGAGPIGWQAPVSFLGDKSAAEGGVLLFDLRTMVGTPPAEARMRGGETTLVHAVEPTSDRGWTTVSLRLDANSGWQIESTGEPATGEDLKRVLSLLESLEVRAPPGSGLDNVVLSAGAAAAEAPAPEDARPERIDLSLDEISGSPGQALNIRVSLTNADDEEVAADKLYRIRLVAEGAEVRPDSVEIPAGGRAAAARVYGERPGPVPISATASEDEIEEGAATMITCGASPITRVVLNAEREEAVVGTPISAVLSLQNDDGVEVSGAPGNKRIKVEVSGVGRLVSEGFGLIADGRCATEISIAAGRAGQSPVTVSLAALPSEQRTFRFVLAPTYLGGAIVGGALLGGLARSGQNWKSSRRWKAGRWAVTLAVSVVAGVAVYLLYAIGLVEALPALPLGYGPALLLGIVGGYLGPTALERVADRVLPGAKKDAA